MVDVTLLSHHTASFAYLDGGTGSMLLQAALAGVLTAGYFVKSQWALVKATINRRVSK
jgi:hypothetical protein